MQSPYLGAIPLHWCDSCHVPVLGKRCGCGAPARHVGITPPGDVRPAFPSDIRLINSIFDEAFGQPLIPDGHIVLLNKVPDDDRMEEIIIGGAVVGAIRYLPSGSRWEALPRPQAGLLMRPKRRYVVVDDGAAPFVQEGSSVLAPGLVEIESHTTKGDEVFVLTGDGTCIGVGRAKMGSDEARSTSRGQIVRLRKNSTQTFLPSPSTWDQAVIANREILLSMEQDSIRFIQDLSEQETLPITVSYSGGKDSLVTLILTLKAIGPVPLLFADTGFEFPETYENIDRVCERYKVELFSEDGEAGFWKGFQKHGPPAVNLRWCCKACKLTPVNDLIEKQWGECLSLIGQRKYESARRMKSRRVWRNQNVPNQLSAAPIQHWNALHVWLYLFQEKAPYNILYEEGLDRIGCYMCPSSDIAHLKMIEERYPDLWSKWRSAVEAWAAAAGRSPEWFSSGAWRVNRGGEDEEDSHY
ncbi:MAG: phosphoadenosine phosphosulfate reductase family protein [Methanocalculus sp.]|uniref:phosphoadenosine phosphosulfate reductase domain-containing protein n=1 Tax=Methanocalculus sp. TaxID=2004547 RepID=UPI00271AA7D5|nr:phosphoadenosine phosphosulfate reductase family protein [Methanocalculus sp.]MDO8842388.1 phosphoadenosine phosphosulfate reductase family protein [Methanocalculus sp.]MDO9538488.1 phosphoadenosine phosphosulfate reductase family protein [Methanocalculus sp.]